MRHFSIAAIMLVLIATPLPAAADERDDALAAIQACREIGADTVRLACLDAATQLLDRLEATPDAPATPALPVTNPDAEAIAQERAQLAAEREALAQERANLERLAAEREATANATAEASVAAEAARLTAERKALEEERTALEAARAENNEAPTKRRAGLLSAPRGIGLFNQDDRPKRYETNVTRIIVNNAGRHFFETEDGTTWRQVPPAALTAPSSLPATVTIRRTASGSRRLAFDEHPNRSYVVVETSTE